ncbi:SOLUTE CARRIER FAMILY 25 [Salix viminalis]|uniref:SOLUTE CARRIER FAMILY 25 n=1 Tax=Salix viminalis TaxID=40686 RepID=A0A9Q0SE07_SALVM|nr:SOLUTE CARRIER FAMILY 25 [Salix viminalis]
MGRGGNQLFDDSRDGFLSIACLGSQWDNVQNVQYLPKGGGLFASVNQMGMGDNSNLKSLYNDLHVKYLSFVGFQEEGVLKKMKGGLKLKIKVKSPSLRRLISGGIAGAISRTAVAPLETIRTHLMVGSSGHSTAEVFKNIMQTDGWKGLFRGNLVNVIRVAPSKAIEVSACRYVELLDTHSLALFAYDTVNKKLSPAAGEQPKLPIPASLVAGACAGVSSTLCMYPLELVKTRLTIQRDVYNGIVHAFLKILHEEGPGELYRGLAPSLIGVIPYAATNYFAYDTLRKAYRKYFKQEKIGNIETLLIGSAAGAMSSSATFPLEVARKHMQVGALSGRQVYKNVIHALASILEQEGIQGLYKGLGPSCIKMVPAAGISFMCYEACKRILVEDDEKT